MTKIFFVIDGISALEIGSTLSHLSTMVRIDYVNRNWSKIFFLSQSHINWMSVCRRKQALAKETHSVYDIILIAALRSFRRLVCIAASGLCIRIRET